MIKSAAAYLRACLGAEQAAAAATEEEAVPTKDDMRRTLDTLAEQIEEDQLDLMYALTYGNLADLVAACREKRAYAPCGAAAAPGGVANAAAEAKEEEGDVDLFILF